MIRLADYLAGALADYGVKHVFMVTGGGAMHLNDAVGRESRLTYICNHHEQACAMAAEGYARVRNHLGVVCVTSGPGGINAMNGVFGAWTDSIPMLIVSGQVKRELCITSHQIPGLRQLGDQEADIIRMVQGITKYAVSVTDPQSIRYHLERALHLATSGRPGPCWIDVPIDVQASQVDPAQLRAYDPAEDAPAYATDRLPDQCREVLQHLQHAQRPVILAGKGVRLAGALAGFDQLIRRLGIPVATGWQAIDLLASDDALYCGRPGDIGNRAGNFAVQNSDLLLVLGCRLSIRHTSHNWQAFARHAFKIQVDADVAELHKPVVAIDLPIHCEVGLVLAELNRQVAGEGFDASRHAGWLAWCRERVERYPVVQPRHRVLKERLINPYHFVEVLFQQLTADDVVVCGDGTANVVGFQAAIIKQGQRVFCNTGDASMGYDLPAAVGAAVARGGGRVICLAGDGSVQMNIQELQTVVHHQLPVKLLVLNNNGYLSIRTSQANFFNHFVGESSRSGVSFPDMVKLAQAYGLPACRIEGGDFSQQLAAVLKAPGPVVCDVMLDPEQSFEPKLSSRQLPDGRMVSAPLEDMYPFLSREELQANLLIPPMEF
ncbi:MAG: thiamine pyrophosphate-binding protein [Verrucomicrobia bacterium]|nr:thiamine pyrophosphate-binding protein [Verrucomicrobiota bacterium]